MISSKLTNVLLIGTVIVTCLSLNINSSPVDTDSQIITEPEPGQEYVFVQSSQSGARPIKRKDKKATASLTSDDESPFETGHKIPTFLTFQQKEEHEKSIVKREAVDIPGAIKIDPSKLIEKYRNILESEITTKKAEVDSTTANIVLTTGGPSTQRSFEIVHGKNKEGGILESDVVNSDAKLTGSGSDKQTSRIQIKKGPNGQDYEYEYVYYYYDDEDPPAGKDLAKNKEEKISNAHDGPARNSITPSSPARGNTNKSRYQTIDRSNSNSASSTLNAEPASNEVVPTTSKTSAKGRGRHVPSDEEIISEERLPPNTRFPPRSRNLSTTPSSTSTTAEAAEEHKPVHIRSRQRGKPAPVQEPTEEPATVSSQQTSRQRTRPNVRRPSLELVDSASFKTHASDASVSQYKELSASRDELNQAKLLGESDSQTATSRSFDTADDIPRAQSLDDEDRERFDSKEEKLYDSSTTENAIISTTLTDEMAAAMDKVALDLYAILQGTQNMIQEDDDTSSTDSTATTETGNPSTEEGSYSTTELLTEEPTTPTTTTTTTTTTQATTTTTTTEPSTPPLPGRGRFRGRTTASSRFRQSATTSTTEASNDVTSKGSRFSPGRTSGFGGRNRLNSRTSTEKSIENGDITKESASVNNNARPSIGGNRSRFGSTRGRGTTTTTTSAPAADSSNSVSAPARPSLTRPRPNFNLRRRGPSSTTEASTSTARSGDAEESSTETPEPSSTTVRSVRPRISGSARPLRPGPRININSRGRIGAVTTTPSSTTAAVISEDNEKVASEEISNAESESSESGEISPTSTTTENALQRLRNRARISVNSNKPKASTAAPVVRRTNPLISRRKPIGVQAESTTESHSSEEISSDDKVQNEVTESPLIEEINSEQPAEVSSVSSTTEARGLNGLLAGRRRLNRRPGTIL